MKKLIFCLLSGAVLMFGSCQSEEPATNATEDNSTGETTTTNDKVVKFTYDATSPSLKTYHSDGSVRWSHSDMIGIISPVSDILDDEHHAAIYTIENDGGGGTSGNFEWLQIADIPPIYWNEGKEQHFYAYYPTNRLGYSPTSQGGITNIDYVTGSANFHIPADQSTTAGIRPLSEEDIHTNPLAYAIAANRSVPIDKNSSVQLEFHDIMNLLRIHINNPTDKKIKGVKVSTTEAGTAENLYPAGTMRIAPPHEDSGITTDYIFGTPADYDHFTFEYAEENAPGVAPYPLTPFSREIIATNAASDVPDLYYDLYLMAQHYEEGTLRVTVMIGDDDDKVNDFTKVIPSDFVQGSIKKVLFNIPNGQSATYDKYGIEMVDIPAGMFDLGGATDGFAATNPHPTVRLSEFKIGKYEVTQSQWEAIISDGIRALQSRTGNAYTILSQAGFAMNGNYLQKDGININNIIASNPWGNSAPGSLWGIGANHPVYFVSYDNITTMFIPFLNALTGNTYKLPSEAQWEYAARGGNYTNDYAGATGRETLHTVAWYNVNPSPDGREPAHPVGQLRPNGYGLFDMNGNAYEWCLDYYSQTYPATVDDNYVNTTTNNNTNRVYRGGSCSGPDWIVSVLTRFNAPPSRGNNSLGFRLAM